MTNKFFKMLAMTILVLITLPTLVFSEGYNAMVGSTRAVMALSELLDEDGSIPFSRSSDGDLLLDAGLLLGDTTTTTTGMLRLNGGAIQWYDGAGWTALGGSVAPADAQYLVLALDGTLTAERVFTAGSNISVTDGGAGGNYTVATSLIPTFTTLSTGQGQYELYAMNQDVETTDAVTFLSMQAGYNGQDGQILLYSEQGITDYTATLNPNSAMTSAANFYLPADEPGSTYILNMTAGGVIGYDTNTYLTAEVDGNISNEINTITCPDANVTAGLGITFAQSGNIAITEAADTITFTVTGVPYTGATSNVDLGAYDLTTDLLTLTDNREFTWGASYEGVRFDSIAATFTESGTPGVRAYQTVHSFGIPTFATDGNAVTITDASNVYIAGPPAAGANMTITNPWALYVGSGNSYFAGSITANSISANIDEQFGITIDGGGAAITTGVKGYLEIPYNMTITGWTILSTDGAGPATAGSIVIDVWVDSYANYPPTVTIAGSEKPTLTAANKNQDLALGTWTTALTKGHILGYNVDSAATVTRVTLIIHGVRL